MRVLLTLLLITAAARSQPHDAVSDEATFTEATDALLAETLDAFPSIPGLAVAVVRDGRTVYSRGAGWADLEAGTRATADTPFYIASATKPFTALLAALLDYDGTLLLETSLADLFPDVRFDLESDSVTVQHLLSHTAGIGNGPIGFRAAYSGQHTPATMHRLLSGTTALEDAPRGAYRYTNVGYNILSLRLDDEGPWQDQLATRIFGPLGMSRTTAYASRAAEWTPAVPYAAGPDGRPERIKLVKHDNTMQAAGGLYASANDLARWLTLHLEGGEIDRRRVVPADVIARVHRPVATGRDDRYGPFGRDGYALGWHTGTYRGEPMRHHFGGFSGFHAHTSFMPERGMGVVVLANEASAGARLAVLIAAFAYDWWDGESTDRDAVLEGARDARMELRAGLDQYLEYTQAQAAERAEDSWQLSLAPSAYAGSYTNVDWGRIEVEAEDDSIAVRFGRLHAPASPHPNLDAIRVQLIPGQEQTVAFVLEDGRVAALRYDGQTFVRCDD